MSDHNNRKRSNIGIRRDDIIHEVKVEEAFNMYENRANRRGLYPKQEENEELSNLPVGEGCYISTVYKSKRFYGILLEQSAINAGTVNYFHDQADSLSMNQRMQLLLNHHESLNGESPDDDKKMSSTQIVALGNPYEATMDHANKTNHNYSSDTRSIQCFKDIEVQKFKYIQSDQGRDGYRILLATYANVLAASEDQDEKALKIHNACECGGNFVGPYYYQYLTEYRTLQSKFKSSDDMAYTNESDYISTSISLDTFLRTGTAIPTWHPLKHSSLSQSKVLRLLNMKSDTRGIVSTDTKKPDSLKVAPVALSNGPRSTFRVCIIGGGIAGIACAEELLRLAEKSKNDLQLEVVIVEARDRLGGRVLTDYETFKDQHGNPIHVDLGASWIHGINKNPLAIKAHDFNLSLIATSEEVKMKILDGPMSVVHEELDKKVEDIFNQLLDDAADYVWKKDQLDLSHRCQDVNRWHASMHEDYNDSRTDVPIHRYSSDISVAKAMDCVKNNNFPILTETEHRLHLWHQKHNEYAFGADLRDISIKYWDLDENESFEGDHAMIKEGFSMLLEKFIQDLKHRYGQRVRVMLNFPVEKIDYGYEGTAYSSMQTSGSNDTVIDISDSCAISNHNDENILYSDFVVSTLPLGVLKRGTDSSRALRHATDTVEFSPPLSNAKVEAIRSLGFGLINKIMLQFPSPAFWRASSDDVKINSPLLRKKECIFGNASACHPSYYMFYDLGRCLERQEDEPAILMAIISGEDAAIMETLSEVEVKDEVLHTLKSLFSDVIIPDPIDFKVTKWGSDKYSLGCYTFLAPGSTPEDYDIVRVPCCKHGDEFLCKDNDIMRLYFAGEHASKEHASLAHGAYLSGIKAAEDIFRNVYKGRRSSVKKYDHEIPVTLYRALQPQSPIRCILCEKNLSNESFGHFVAFYHSARYILVHRYCAINSPEVEYKKGRYRNVISAIKRGRQLKCHACGQAGATVGCINKTCRRSFHVPCCVGWNFSRSKAYLCTEHNVSKSVVSGTNSDKKKLSERSVSVQYFRERNPGVHLACALCHKSFEVASQLGDFDVFERNKYGIYEFMVYHKQCLLFSNVIDPLSTTEEKPSVFDVFTSSRQCSACQENGATVRCSAGACTKYFHFPCCQKNGLLDLERKTYLCSSHILISVDEDSDDHSPTRG